MFIRTKGYVTGLQLEPTLVDNQLSVTLTLKLTGLNMSQAAYLRQLVENISPELPPVSQTITIEEENLHDVPR